MSSSRFLALVLCRPGTRVPKAEGGVSNVQVVSLPETVHEEDLEKLDADWTSSRSFLRSSSAIISPLSAFSAELDADEVHRKLQNFFEDDAMLHIVIYLGHGRKHDGAWQLARNTSIAFDSVLRLWRSTTSMQSRIFFVVSDSCYSGKLCLEASRWALPNVFVQSSCDVGQKAVDGRFMPLWVQVQSHKMSCQDALMSLSPQLTASQSFTTSASMQKSLMKKGNQAPIHYSPSLSGNGAALTLHSQQSQQVFLFIGHRASIAHPMQSFRFLTKDMIFFHRHIVKRSFVACLRNRCFIRFYLLAAVGGTLSLVSICFVVLLHICVFQREWFYLVDVTSNADFATIADHRYDGPLDAHLESILKSYDLDESLIHNSIMDMQLRPSEMACLNRYRHANTKLEAAIIHRMELNETAMLRLLFQTVSRPGGHAIADNPAVFARALQKGSVDVEASRLLYLETVGHIAQLGATSQKLLSHSLSFVVEMVSPITNGKPVINEMAELANHSMRLIVQIKAAIAAYKTDAYLEAKFYETFGIFTAAYTFHQVLCSGNGLYAVRHLYTGFKLQTMPQVIAHLEMAATIYARIGFLGDVARLNAIIALARYWNSLLSHTKSNTKQAKEDCDFALDQAEQFGLALRSHGAIRSVLNAMDLLAAGRILLHPLPH